MKSTRIVSALAALSGLAVADLQDAPSPANFYRRGGMRATVLGSFVYIDGGEIVQLVNGKLDGQARQSNQVNSTLSIDMTKSWNNSDVVLLSSASKLSLPGTIKNHATLWTDAAATSFYTWAGEATFGINVSAPVLYRFVDSAPGTPNAGHWSALSPANPSVYSSLLGTVHGAFASARGVGYQLGGAATPWTQPGRGDTGGVAGLVSYDMTSQSWSNATDDAAVWGSLNDAVAQYVPAFGGSDGAGLIFVLGGATQSVVGDPTTANLALAYNDLKNLTFFDPNDTGRRYWQVATGDVPPAPRSKFCMAGFRGPKGSYEILLFGGLNPRDNTNYADAYVLSLPGFVWTKVPLNPAGARSDHVCVAVGQRQVLSIGGAGDGADPAVQGLLLFDMTSWSWKTSFDASAATYEPNAAVESFYANWTADSVQWSSDEVKQMFNTTNLSTPKKSDGHSTPTGAIVGGVVGGVVLIAIIAVAVVMLRRRQRRAAGGTYHDPARASMPPAEYALLDTKSPMHETQTYGYRGELDAQSRPVEAPTAELRHELDGGEVRR